MLAIIMTMTMIMMSNNGAVILNFSEKYLSQCHFVNLKSYTDWPGTKTERPRCVKRPEPWLGRDDGDDDDDDDDDDDNDDDVYGDGDGDGYDDDDSVNMQLSCA
jgi:hypothetical protein